MTGSELCFILILISPPPSLISPPPPSRGEQRLNLSIDAAAYDGFRMKTGISATKKDELVFSSVAVVVVQNI